MVRLIHRLDLHSLLRGVIGSTTVSGTVSWGSSPYGVTISSERRRKPPQNTRFCGGLFVFWFASLCHFCKTLGPLVGPLVQLWLAQSVRQSFVDTRAPADSDRQSFERVFVDQLRFDCRRKTLASPTATPPKCVFRLPFLILQPFPERRHI